MYKLFLSHPMKQIDNIFNILINIFFFWHDLQLTIWVTNIGFNKPIVNLRDYSNFTSA